MTQIKERVSLKNYSTYKIGGPAKYFCEAAGTSDVEEAVKFVRDKHLQIFIIGGGSNLIISDKGFDGLVIKIGNCKLTLPDRAVLQRQSFENYKAEVGAGFDMSQLVQKTTKMGLAGLEWAGGLPGSVGGAIFGNAGCFGHEIKEIVHSVKAIKISTNDLRATSYDKKQCEFSYRNSKFKREGYYIIFSAVLKFQKGDASELQRLAGEKIEYRKNRHPLEYPNIGSIFKNIDEREKVNRILKSFPELEESVKNKWFGKIPTAVLVEKAGLAGKQIGGAQVSQKHANFIINKEKARAVDVVKLIKEVKSKVKELVGIELEEEVRYIGF